MGDEFHSAEIRKVRFSLVFDRFAHRHRRIMHQQPGPQVHRTRPLDVTASPAASVIEPSRAARCLFWTPRALSPYID